ncbi:MAG: hypothetical protein NVSMB32_00010 [Actinomycetota bacterium]
MSDISSPCASLSTGQLEPDLRVNYELGMVLGIDEFRQEALYFLTKDYLHNRGLHGYGTVYGLHVTTDQARPTDDVTITVAPGMAIDQWGRAIVLRSPQCAHLGAWLASQEQLVPGTVKSHLGVSGELTVYVVVSYAECLDDLVPLPGQPCSTSGDLSVASRIRDAWNLELRWQPPAMPAWDAVRRLAKLLDSIEVVDGPVASDEEAIKAAVRALAPGSLPAPLPSLPLPSLPGPHAYRLPAASSAEAFDRILVVWVSEVRPLLAPDLTDPQSTGFDPAVLLSTITFVPASPFSPTAPSIVFAHPPKDEGRPYLLHTQLLQELRGAHSAAVVPAPAGPPVRQLVTLSTELQAGQPIGLRAWFHLGQPVMLSSPVRVTPADGAATLFGVAVAGPQPTPGFSDQWSLLAPGGVTLANGELLEASFDTAAVLVGGLGTTLADVLTAGVLGLLDQDAPNRIEAYTQVLVPPALPAQPAPPASAEFVTITPTRRVLDEPFQQILRMTLWFHPNPSAPDGTGTQILAPLGLDVFAEAGGPTATPIPFDPPTEVFPNVFTLQLKAAPETPFLRFAFNTKATNIQTGGNTMSLEKFIEGTGIRFLGWHEPASLILSYVQTGDLVR